MKYEIGIDEVGRGPIAGPVAVGAFLFLDEKARRQFKSVKESKQLSEAKREEWFALIEEHKKKGLLDFAVSFQGEKVIDSKGISFAIKKALKESLEKVCRNLRPSHSNGLEFKGSRGHLGLRGSQKCSAGSNAKLTRLKLPNFENSNDESVSVLLDGGLKAPLEFINQETIIKGDEKIQVIALASICAKVLRDRKMIKLGKKHRQYGFERHKGYGTKEHYMAIRKHGILGAHRRSFLRGL